MQQYDSFVRRVPACTARVSLRPRYEDGFELICAFETGVAVGLHPRAQHVDCANTPVTSAS